MEKKIAYLQGVFEDLSEGYGINHDENYIHFANSSEKVERCKKWINQVARYMLENRLYTNWSIVGVTKHEITYGYPICNTVSIEPEVVKFIKEFKNKKLCK